VPSGKGKKKGGKTFRVLWQEKGNQGLLREPQTCSILLLGRDDEDGMNCSPTKERKSGTKSPQ